MSQHDYILDNQAGASFRADANLLFGAMVSLNSGLTAPATTYAFMPWMDTTAALLKHRNSADSAWVTVASFNGITWIPYRSGTVLGDAAEQTVGTAARAHLPNVEDVVNQQGIYLAATGSAGAYVVTMIPAIGGYVEGQRFVFKANHESPDGPTLNVNAKGAGNLVDRDGIALSAGDIKVDQMVEVQRTASDFQVISPLGKGLVTGDMVMFFGTTAPNGFVLADGGTLGSAISGGTTRANADTESLFEFLWNNLADAEAPVSTGRGASAQADFDANKNITIPDYQGRSPIGSGAGSGLTARILGADGGEEDHQNTISEMPSHNHPNVTVPGTQGTLAGGSAVNILGITGSRGGNVAHNTMHPFTVCNMKIKL